MIAVAIACGLTIGLLLGAVGGGGSLFVLPVFVYVLGEPVATATTGSLAVVGAAAAVAAARACADGAVCWRLARDFAPTVLAGSALGAVVGLRVPGEVVIIGFVPLLLAAALVTATRVGDRARVAPPGCPTAPPAQVAAVGLAVGFVTGFFGVGGGFVFVPALTLIVGLGMRRAAATSLVVICLAAAAGLVAHAAGGGAMDPAAVAAVAVAASIGAFAGAAWGGRLPQRRLAQGFSALAAAAALLLLADLVLTGGPPS